MTDPLWDRVARVYVYTGTYRASNHNRAKVEMIDDGVLHLQTDNISHLRVEAGSRGTVPVVRKILTPSISSFRR